MNDSLVLRQAFRILHRRMDRATRGSDPAPWCEAVGADARKIKIEAAVTRAMRIGLLDGSLIAFWAVDGVKVPAWAWCSLTWAFSSPHISALLPPEWHKYRGELVGSLDRQSFRQWLQRVDLTPVEGEPALPLAVDGDSKPAPLDRLLPPDEGFVSLGHALSWAAWSISLPAHWWDDAVARGELGPDAKERLDTALTGLLRLGRKDELAFAGRYSARYPDNARDTLPIDRHKLQDFGRYDTLRDGLQRGSGFAWGGPGTAFDDLFDGPADGFAQVIVDRAQLLADYPPPPTNSVGTGLPGRPTLGRDIIDAMLEERIMAGTALPRLPGEVAELLRLFRNNPDLKHHQAPKSKTVENNVRARHKEAFPLKL